MPTLEDELRLEQIRKLRMQQVQEPPVQAPPPVSQQPYLQAEQLTTQANTPRPDPFAGMSPLKRMLARGLGGMAEAAIHGPGAVHQLQQQQFENDRLQRNDLLARAKELRGEGREASQDFRQSQMDQLNLENTQYNRARQLRQDELAEQNTRSLIEDRNKPSYSSSPLGIFEQSTGKVITPAPTGAERQYAPPSSVAEYNFYAEQEKAAGRPPVSFDAYQARDANRRQSTAQPDYEWVNRGGKLVQIRKGTAQPGDTPYSAAQTNPGETGGYQAERATRIVDDVDDIIDEIDSHYFTTGVGTDALANVPIVGQAARNLRAHLKTLESNIRNKELQEMRADSKTGGALGNVSDEEGRALASSLGSLEATQDAATLKAQLNKIKNSIMRWQKEKNLAQGGRGRNADTPPGNKPKTMILGDKTLTLGADGLYH